MISLQYNKSKKNGNKEESKPTRNVSTVSVAVKEGSRKAPRLNGVDEVDKDA